ncbi:ABC transporter substrate-binding protein [Actinoplanes sp. SE50]|uniref:glutamate ABC transporter substrate-binding protein n=1 Tax=unclassified Actinoplanes TaxID=2626549 RepID=UPI00023ED0D7|nr:MULTISPECIES: glutamate ABC transporter substrate-binding protein [unclassified Actinoplanes]AEV86093.1 Membrane-bound lytic murein transglycosylase F [Actinoplanes sp. SE50/110]ATO84491.1 ABC transporter substrate-binding protein [Actinoplanes sp. SE50]SLM01901.1 ABC transporter substrate-binding protein [Actinoplanes sp. SE50/110]
MRARLALIVTAALLLGSAGCAGDSSPRYDATPGPTTSGGTVIDAAPGPSTGATPAPDTSCNPRASLRPSGALPQPGAMPAASLMAQIRQRGRLILGTSQDTLLFSSRNPQTGKVEGFDVDMARLVAQAIFGDRDKVQIKVIPYNERVNAVLRGDVDLVADTMTANCARWKDVDFSTTYYEAGQKVLVKINSTATGIEDLAGQKVCAATGSTSYDTIARVRTKPIPVAKPTFGDCLVAFQQNEVDAISTDDTILAGMAAQDPYAKVVGQRYTEEPYGMAMNKQHPEFTRFVNAVLDRARQDGTWAKTYETWLGRFGAAPKPPAAQYR